MNRPIFTRSRCSLPLITRPFLLTTAFEALPLGWAKYSTRPLDADGLKSKFLFLIQRDRRFDMRPSAILRMRSHTGNGTQPFATPNVSRPFTIELAMWMS